MNSARDEKKHISVLPDEVLEYLQPEDKELIVDATLGMGGHTELILESASHCRVIGIDQDIEALEIAEERLSGFRDRFRAYKSNFSGIRDVLKAAGIEKVDGIVADLGVSSLQFDSETRGFSFRFDAPLDMRMDAESDAETAAELLARLSEEEIANLIYRFGEERFSRRIARNVVKRRKAGEPLETTLELAALVERSVPRRRNQKVHPATKTFQALRIAVNKELEILDSFIKDSIDLLKSGGRLVIITFHSLEDRIVKHAFRHQSGKCSCSPKLPQCECGAEKKVEILTRKPVVPSDDEQTENPRSRSAKLRACSRI